MRSETGRKGEIAKFRVLLRAYEKHFIVSIPTIDTDYDIILDSGKKLYRGQIKYADAPPSRSKGCIFLGLRRTTWNKKVLTYDKKDVDVLLVYLQKMDKILWLPPSIWHKKTSISIRYEDSKNNQKKGVLRAQNYIW